MADAVAVRRERVVDLHSRLPDGLGKPDRRLRRRVETPTQVMVGSRQVAPATQLEQQHAWRPIGVSVAGITAGSVDRRLAYAGDGQASLWDGLPHDDRGYVAVGIEYVDWGKARGDMGSASGRAADQGMHMAMHRACTCMRQGGQRVRACECQLPAGFLPRAHARITRASRARAPRSP